MRRQSSGPPSPWGTREAKKRFVDTMNSENSEIHSYTGDIAVTGCAKVNYAKILELYAPKNEMNKFHPNFKILIECKMHMTGSFKKMAKPAKNLNLGILAARTQVVHTHFSMIHTFWKEGKLNCLCVCLCVCVCVYTSDRRSESLSLNID